ncbi:clotting factor C-like, partial [Condylostylus longicornis]|uniref:clotting factor C-like n=1 Tax=Condylostylus longicornis TaxID=2530218 RepID=UPI00244E2EF5
LRPEYSTQCSVPHVDPTIDLSCYSNFKSDALRRCPKTVPILQTTCQIGYEKVNSNGNDIVSLCVGNRWTVDDQFDSACKLICGEAGSNGEPVPLIFKGTSTDIKNAPWHVGIYSNNTKASSSYELICSGSIIHRNIVISAAHCFYNKLLRKTDDPRQFLIGAGKRFYSYRKSENTEQFVRVQEIHTLRTYDTSLLRNDIAVLVVTPDFTFTSTVKPVCIDWTTYWDYDLENGTVGHIFGWGANSKDDILTIELSTASLNALSSEDCKRLNKKAEVSAESFCAVNDNGASACKGDSGGGFVVKRTIGSKERYVLWGIVSSGVANDYCSDGGITIFTNIQYFQEAIKAIISKSKPSLSTDNFSKLLYHQIYAHIIYTPLNWAEKELKLNLGP